MDSRDLDWLRPRVPSQGELTSPHRCPTGAKLELVPELGRHRRPTLGEEVLPCAGEGRGALGRQPLPLGGDSPMALFQGGEESPTSQRESGSPKYNGVYLTIFKRPARLGRPWKSGARSLGRLLALVTATVTGAGDLEWNGTPQSHERGTSRCG
jgi:hypothetical protein